MRFFFYLFIIWTSYSHLLIIKHVFSPVYHPTKKYEWFWIIIDNANILNKIHLIYKLCRNINDYFYFIILIDSHELMNALFLFDLSTDGMNIKTIQLLIIQLESEESTHKRCDKILLIPMTFTMYSTNRV